MLPDDPYFDAKDPGSDFPPGLANALQRSVGCEKAAWASGTFPAPTGTTLPWGGAKIVVYRGTLGADSTVIADDSIDWRNRLLLIIGGIYTAEADLPGNGTEPVNQPDFDYPLNQDLKAVPIITGYLNESTRIEICQLPSGYVKIETNASGELLLHGVSTAAALYPVLWIVATDQFPART